MISMSLKKRAQVDALTVKGKPYEEIPIVIKPIPKEAPKKREIDPSDYRAIKKFN